MRGTVYTITADKGERSTSYTGTPAYLVDEVFGYTIECNRKSKNTARRSLQGLLNGLCGTSYWSISTSYSGRLATPAEKAEWLAEVAE